MNDALKDITPACRRHGLYRIMRKDGLRAPELDMCFRYALECDIGLEAGLRQWGMQRLLLPDGTACPEARAAWEELTNPPGAGEDNEHGKDA